MINRQLKAEFSSDSEDDDIDSELSMYLTAGDSLAPEKADKPFVKQEVDNLTKESENIQSGGLKNDDEAITLAANILVNGAENRDNHRLFESSYITKLTQEPINGGIKICDNSFKSGGKSCSGSNNENYSKDHAIDGELDMDDPLASYLLGPGIGTADICVNCDSKTESSVSMAVPDFKFDERDSSLLQQQAKIKAEMQTEEHTIQTNKPRDCHSLPSNINEQLEIKPNGSETFGKRSSVMSPQEDENFFIDTFFENCHNEDSDSKSNTYLHQVKGLDPVSPNTEVAKDAQCKQNLEEISNRSNQDNCDEMEDFDDALAFYLSGNDKSEKSRRIQSTESNSCTSSYKEKKNEVPDGDPNGNFDLVSAYTGDKFSLKNNDCEIKQKNDTIDSGSSDKTPHYETIAVQKDVGRNMYEGQKLFHSPSQANGFHSELLSSSFKEVNIDTTSETKQEQHHKLSYNEESNIVDCDSDSDGIDDPLATYLDLGVNSPNKATQADTADALSSVDCLETKDDVQSETTNSFSDNSNYLLQRHSADNLGESDATHNFGCEFPQNLQKRVDNSGDTPSKKLDLNSALQKQAVLCQTLDYKSDDNHDDSIQCPLSYHLLSCRNETAECANSDKINFFINKNGMFESEINCKDSQSCKVSQICQEHFPTAEHVKQEGLWKHSPIKQKDIEALSKMLDYSSVGFSDQVTIRSPSKIVTEPHTDEHEGTSDSKSLVEITLLNAEVNCDGMNTSYSASQSDMYSNESSCDVIYSAGTLPNSKGLAPGKNQECLIKRSNCCMLGIYTPVSDNNLEDTRKPFGANKLNVQILATKEKEQCKRVIDLKGSSLPESCQPIIRTRELNEKAMKCEMGKCQDFKTNEVPREPVGRFIRKNNKLYVVKHVNENPVLEEFILSKSQQKAEKIIMENNSELLPDASTEMDSDRLTDYTRNDEPSVPLYANDNNQLTDFNTCDNVDDKIHTKSDNHTGFQTESISGEMSNDLRQKTSLTHTSVHNGTDCDQNKDETTDSKENQCRSLPTQFKTVSSAGQESRCMKDTATIRVFRVEQSPNKNKSGIIKRQFIILQDDGRYQEIESHEPVNQSCNSSPIINGKSPAIYHQAFNKDVEVVTPEARIGEHLYREKNGDMMATKPVVSDVATQSDQADDSCNCKSKYIDFTDQVKRKLHKKYSRQRIRNLNEVTQLNKKSELNEKKELIASSTMINNIQSAEADRKEISQQQILRGVEENNCIKDNTIDPKPGKIETKISDTVTKSRSLSSVLLSSAVDNDKKRKRNESNTLENGNTDTTEQSKLLKRSKAFGLNESNEKNDFSSSLVHNGIDCDQVNKMIRCRDPKETSLNDKTENKVDGSKETYKGNVHIKATKYHSGDSDIQKNKTEACKIAEGHRNRELKNLVINMTHVNKNIVAGCELKGKCEYITTRLRKRKERFSDLSNKVAKFITTTERSDKLKTISTETKRQVDKTVSPDNLSKGMPMFQSSLDSVIEECLNQVRKKEIASLAKEDETTQAKMFRVENKIKTNEEYIDENTNTTKSMCSTLYDNGTGTENRQLCHLCGWLMTKGVTYCKCIQPDTEDRQLCHLCGRLTKDDIYCKCMQHEKVFQSDEDRHTNKKPGLDNMKDFDQSNEQKTIARNVSDMTKMSVPQDKNDRLKSSKKSKRTRKQLKVRFKEPNKMLRKDSQIVITENKARGKILVKKEASTKILKTKTTKKSKASLMEKKSCKKSQNLSKEVKDFKQVRETGGIDLAKPKTDGGYEEIKSDPAVNTISKNEIDLMNPMMAEGGKVINTENKNCGALVISCSEMQNLSGKLGNSDKNEIPKRKKSKIMKVNRAVGSKRKLCLKHGRNKAGARRQRKQEFEIWKGLLSDDAFQFHDITQTRKKPDIKHVEKLLKRILNKTKRKDQENYKKHKRKHNEGTRVKLEDKQTDTPEKQSSCHFQSFQFSPTSSEKSYNDTKANWENPILTVFKPETKINAVDVTPTSMSVQTDFDLQMENMSPLVQQEEPSKLSYTRTLTSSQLCRLSIAQLIDKANLLKEKKTAFTILDTSKKKKNYSDLF